jgi:hypothetical protein
MRAPLSYTNQNEKDINMRRPASAILIDFLESYCRYNVCGAKAFLSHLRNKKVIEIAFNGTEWKLHSSQTSKPIELHDASEFDGEFIMSLAEDLVRAGAMRQGTRDAEDAMIHSFYKARLPNLDTLRLRKNSLHWKAWPYPIPTLDALEALGTITSSLKNLLQISAAKGQTIIVAGRGESGKSTLVNAVARHAVESRPGEVFFLDEQADEIFLPLETCVQRASVLDLERLHSWGGGLIATHIDRKSFYPALEVAGRCQGSALLETTSSSNALDMLQNLRGHITPSLNHVIDYILMMSLGGSSGVVVSAVWQVRLDWSLVRIDCL